MDRQKTDELLEQIRAVLVLMAVKGGASSDEVGRVLGLDGSTVRHLLAGPKPKRATRK